MRKYLFIFLASLLACPLSAQIIFIRSDSVPVIANSQPLSMPWVGGINFAQFSDIDLDQDGTPDLFVFDRTGNKITTYLNNGTPNQVDYVAAPQYVYQFPLLHDWALLRDYNCDGKMDIFTAFSEGPHPGIAVWKNTSTLAGGLSFQLVEFPILTNKTPNSTNILDTLKVSNVDIPALRDVDNDGDLDVLTFELSGVSIEFHRNLSMELYGTCDSLTFRLENLCWGNISENTLNSSLTLNTPCPSPPAVSTEIVARLDRHNGSCLECFGTDGDADTDILIGDLSNSHIVYGRNGGSTASALIDTVDTFYPNYDSTVEMNLFNCAYRLDVDNDGNDDLIFAPNAMNTSANFRSAWYYHNTGTDDSVRAQFVKNGFLQDEMIEVGEGAFPRFHDYDNDNDEDLFIANYGYHSNSGLYPSKIALYKNTGSPTTPAYQLVTDDFADLFANTSGITCPVPAFGDLDGDGDADMIIGDAAGRLHYYRKDPGPADNFVFVQSFYQGIDVGNYATPQLADVDRDGILDLLIGEQSGNVNYYRNTGTASSPTFALTSALFGNAIVTEAGFTTGYSVPFLWDDGGDYVLLVGSERGFLFRYDNIDGNLSGSFTLTDSLYVSSREGLRIAPWMADIDNDTIMDLVLGNYAGGVSLFMGNLNTGMNELSSVPAFFDIYPNPAQETITITSTLPAHELPATISLFTLEGKQVLSQRMTSSQEKINVSSLAAGVYSCTVQTKSGAASHRKIVINP